MPSVDRRPMIAQGERKLLGVCKRHIITKKDSSKINTKIPEEDPVIDIDEFDKNDELAQVDYVEEIYSIYKNRETEGSFTDYINFQPHINSKTRACLIDWIIEVHDCIGLMPETLYLSINIVDRYLSVTTIHIPELQLVGICALLLSSKYEEEWRLLTIDDMIEISDYAYSRDQILDMEKAILTCLGWYLSVPTPYVFIMRFAKASLPYDKKMEDMVFFFTDLGLTHYSITKRNNPSKLAAAAVYAARCTLNKTPAWTQTLKHYTGYAEDQLKDCAKRLVSFHAGLCQNKLQAVYKKYLDSDRSAISLCPPATSLLVVNPLKAIVPLALMNCQIR